MLVAARAASSGDEVLAYDPETGERGPREVIATLPHSDQLGVLYVDNAEPGRFDASDKRVRNALREAD